MISTLASGASSLFLLSLLSGIESACATETKCSKVWIAPADGELYPTYEEATNCSLPHVPAEVDAIIVGAGYSGLMSAFTIQNTGYTTLVLEAKDRIGGKVRSSKLSNGGIIELGATWINNKTQPAVTRLAEMFNLDLVVQYVEGKSVFEDYDGQVRKVPSNISYTSPDPVAQELEEGLLTLMYLAGEEMDLRKWDVFPQEQDVSFADWAALNEVYDHPYVKGVVRALTTALVGREPNEVGAQYLLDYVKAGQGMKSLGMEDSGGAQFLKIKQGTTAIANGLAQRLWPGSVLVNTPVVAIKEEQDYTLVTAESGQVFKARKVIMANPTNTYDDIDFSPPLPCQKAKIVHNTLPGVYAKMIVSYTEAWWREAGMVGKFTSFIGPIGFSWDTSSTEQNSLALFMAGDMAADWAELPSDVDRINAAIEHLASIVGEELADKARELDEVQFVNWTEEDFLEGGPTSAMGPGAIRKYGTAFRAPFGNIHFGGGETAFEWKGYLEGAIESGLRAAKEVTQVLENECRE